MEDGQCGERAGGAHQYTGHVHHAPAEVRLRGALGLPAAAARAGGGAGPAEGTVLEAPHAAAAGARQVRTTPPAPGRSLPAPLN